MTSNDKSLVPDAVAFGVSGTELEEAAGLAARTAAAARRAAKPEAVGSSEADAAEPAGTPPGGGAASDRGTTRYAA